MTVELHPPVPACTVALEASRFSVRLPIWLLRNALDRMLHLAEHTRMDYSKLITIDPARRAGKPCIRNTRITVYDVLDYLASGMREKEILKDFPELTGEDIRACLAFAADRERRLAGAM